MAATYATPFKERRKDFSGLTTIDRKSWEAEGSAVLVFVTNLSASHNPSLCHLDRSEAEWRDLQFS
jgi:hypothetical protein